MLATMLTLIPDLLADFDLAGILYAVKYGGLMMIGFSLRSITSRVVWSPQCEQSMSIPSRFIRSTARSPSTVSPPSRGSLRPEPSAFASL